MPRHSAVDKRARRYAARQFVSDYELPPRPVRIRGMCERIPECAHSKLGGKCTSWPRCHVADRDTV